MRPTKRVLAALVLLSSVAAAQQYVNSIYAGGAPCPTPVRGVDASLGAGFGVAADTATTLLDGCRMRLFCVAVKRVAWQRLEGSHA